MGCARRILAFGIFLFVGEALAASQFDYAECIKSRGDSAIAGCTRVIEDRSESVPGRASAYNNRGNAYRAKDDMNRAIADYDEAIGLDPKYAAAFRNRGNAYRAKGDHDRAIAEYSEAIRLDPNDALAFNNRGVAYRAKGDHGRAIADYSEAIRLDPKHASAFNNRGIAYRAKGDHDRAIADYNEAIRLDPKDALAFNNRGIAYRAKGDHDRAIADYSEAIRLDPNDALAFNNRGNAYRAKDDIDAAIADYGEVIRLDPKHASAFSNRGWMSFTKGDFQDAAADAIRAIEIEADANKILLRFLARARGGEAAGPELDANAGRLKTKEWPFAVIEMLMGKSTPEATLRAARKPGEVCMAHFYIGEWHLLRDQKTEAATALQRAADMCPTEYLNLNAARAELKRLGAGRDAAEQAKSGPEHGTANQLQARVDTQPSSPFLNRTIDPGVRVEFERFLEMLDQVLRVNPKSEFSSRSSLLRSGDLWPIATGNDGLRRCDAVAA